MVPEGWMKCHLRDLLDVGVKNGYSPNATHHETGYWVLGLGALGDHSFITTEIKPVDLTPKVEQTLLKNGDFLVSRSNTPDKVGRSVRFKGEVPNCSYPDLMMRFRVDESEADPDFIEASLKSTPIRSYYKNCAAGSSSTMVKINKATVEKTPILLPPLGEQKKIAKILSTWDKAIATVEKLIANSQQQKKALMQQLLTGKKRLPGFGGEWVKKKVGEILAVRKDKQVPNEDTPLYSLTIENGITAKTERYNRDFLVKDTDLKKYKVVWPKDIVYNPANLRWGAINYSRLEHSVVVSPIYEVLFIADTKNDCLEFVAQSLMSTDQINRFASMVEGTLMERKAVKIEPFLATKIAVPPTREEQEEIAAVLVSSDYEIDFMQQQLSLLKDEKKALMQQLLTGKRRVKVESIGRET